jgi:hypothetical protein
MAATDPGAAPPRNSAARRYRRRLRSRIILSFVLLGLGLTALFAFLTQEARNRVENALVEDVMNRNIDEYARRYYVDPSRNPDMPVQQMVGRVVRKDRFDALRMDQPDWYVLSDGIHNLSGIDDDGSAFSYKLAVRKTPEEWFFLAYDMTQATQGEEQFRRAVYGAVILFTLLSLLIGWWSASRVMRPVIRFGS